MVQYLSNSTFSLDLHCWVCRVNHNNTAWMSVPRHRLKHVCAVKCLECHRVWMCHKVACQAPVQRLRERKASNNGRRKMWRGTIKLRLAWSLLFILWGKFSAMLNHYAVEHDLQKYSRALRASLPFLYWKIMGLYPIKTAFKSRKYYMLFNSISLLKLFRCSLYAQEGLQQTCVSLRVCYCAEFSFMIENQALGIFIMKYISLALALVTFYSSGFTSGPRFYSCL